MEHLCWGPPPTHPLPLPPPPPTMKGRGKCPSKHPFLAVTWSQEQQTCPCTILLALFEGLAWKQAALSKTGAPLALGCPQGCGSDCHFWVGLGEGIFLIETGVAAQLPGAHPPRPPWCLHRHAHCCSLFPCPPPKATEHSKHFPSLSGRDEMGEGHGSSLERSVHFPNSPGWERKRGPFLCPPLAAP